LTNLKLFTNIKCINILSFERLRNEIFKWIIIEYNLNISITYSDFTQLCGCRKIFLNSSFNTSQKCFYIVHNIILYTIIACLKLYAPMVLWRYSVGWRAAESIWMTKINGSVIHVFDKWKQLIIHLRLPEYNGLLIL